MSTDCALLSGMPSTFAGAKRMLINKHTGSFAAEWIGSQAQARSLPEMLNSYLEHIPAIWSEVADLLKDLEVDIIGDARVAQLQCAFETKEVVGILAHHNDAPDSFAQGIELSDTTLSVDALASIAPVRPIVVHLGICRSKILIEAIKSRCSRVRVIASHAQVDPEFFLRTFARTVQLWRHSEGDYVAAHVQLRMAMLDRLGVG